MFQYADIFQNRGPKNIYIHIECENSNFHLLSGKFNFHSEKNQAPVFIRDGGKIDDFETENPYYLSYVKSDWYIQSSTSFDLDAERGWLKLETKGLFIFKLEFVICIMSNLKKLIIYR